MGHRHSCLCLGNYRELQIAPRPAVTPTTDDFPPATTRYSPGANPIIPKNPLPSVCVVRVSCVITDSIETSVPSPSIEPITAPVVDSARRGGGVVAANSGCSIFSNGVLPSVAVL